MSPLHTGTATLPKGFRYEGGDRDPRTPEPAATGEMEAVARLPSPPRARLRLKRRNVSSHLTAPTQHFLASVAAADVPIPSVEEPEIATADEEMMNNLPNIRLHDFDQDYDGMDIYKHIHARTFSPPKTPAYELAPAISQTAFPNWSIESTWSSSDMESSPEYESSRPSTAFSTQSSASLFSHFSHASASDDGDCLSPEVDIGDFPKLDLRGEESHVRKSKSRKAPWTKAMSAHLWSTYSLYLQDPRVTPVRLGKSCIPPEGVCARVAREAKRSWKGSNTTGTRSGSSTPTAESSKPFIQWPHTCAATRAHLRELCKLKASRPGRPSYLSQSPTPFTKSANRRWNRRSAPARSPSVFSAQDMAMSLMLSTSEAMQAHGPLAQLGLSQPEPVADLTDSETGISAPEDSPVLERARLGSPFFARSYGPSSSSTLAAGIQMRRQSHTVGPRKLLKSPVRLSRPGTQKRRSVKGLEDQPRKRPSLTAAFWGPPSNSLDEQSQPAGLVHEALFKSTDSTTCEGLSNPLMPADPFVSSVPQTQEYSMASAPRPARLGSPFSGSSSSQSFPSRLSNPVNFNLTALRRPFATVQQSSEASLEPAATPRSSLASRLAYIDQRLKEFRSRGSARRRSQSPM